MVRLAKENDLHSLLELYLFLHENEIPDNSEHLRKTWKQIMDSPEHNIIVYETDGKIVSSCVCVIIPNLTRNVRPYAFIENVVTHADYQNRGYATACLDYAKQLSMSAGCYKMMLLTGSKNESTLNFYKQAGFNCEDKTAFIQWL